MGQPAVAPDTHLTGMTAAAAAAASFGVFFSTIWSMANALSSWRLAAISVLALVLASVWLIVNNRLWERTSVTSTPRARLYNTATVCTVAFSWIVLYAFLFGATLVAAMIVIDESFLSSQLGFPAEFRSYVHLAWLASRWVSSRARWAPAWTVTTTSCAPPMVTASGCAARSPRNPRTPDDRVHPVRASAGLALGEHREAP